MVLKMADLTGAEADISVELYVTVCDVLRRLKDLSRWQCTVSVCVVDGPNVYTQKQCANGHSHSNQSIAQCHCCTCTLYT